MKLFKYSGRAHKRKHGPLGYTRYKSYKPWLRDEFTFRCVYCLDREAWNGPTGANVFSTEHFTPVSVNPSLKLDYENLLYVCVRCNSAKRDLELPLDPCVNALGRHLKVEDTGEVRALTKRGQEFILTMGLEADELTIYRRRQMKLVRLLRNSTDPDAPELLDALIGYPSKLPNLARYRPPGGNSRPSGVDETAFRRKQQAQLKRYYW